MTMFNPAFIPDSPPGYVFVTNWEKNKHDLKVLSKQTGIPESAFITLSDMIAGMDSTYAEEQYTKHVKAYWDYIENLARICGILSELLGSEFDYD